MNNEHAAWLNACAVLDPKPAAPPTPKIAAEDAAALATPATLAAHLSPYYVARPHTDAIAEEIVVLEKAVDPTQDGPRLMIDAPPQSGKTYTAVIWSAFWWLCLHPRSQVMIICYGVDLAEERGEAVRNLVAQHGHKYGLHLDKSTHAKRDWKLTTGGALRCFGIKTGITGYPGDICWIDDLTKSRAEAASPVMRQAIHNAYSADIGSRLAPGAPVIVVATRWTEDDLSGRRQREEGLTINGGRWRKLHLPAICDKPNDALGRNIGDPLPHPKIPDGDRTAALRHWEEKKRTTIARDWFALYQGDPQPAEGALLTWKQVEERRCFATPDRPCASPRTIAVAVDPSGEANGNRDTAGIIGGYLGVDERLYLTHDRSGHYSPADWARRTCELAAEIDADRIIVETNFGGALATLAIRTAWESLRRENPTRYSVFVPRLVEVRAKRGKLLRAEPIAQQWVEDKIRTAQYLPDLESEWCVAEGQIVTTSRGGVPIEHVQVGDRVATRMGWKRVSWSGLIGKKEVLTISTTHGDLVCTPDHKVFVVGRGWVQAQEVEASDRMLTCPPDLDPTTLTSTAAATDPETQASGWPTPPNTGLPHIGAFTERFGLTSAARYPSDGTSSTSMATRVITPLPTSVLNHDPEAQNKYGKMQHAHSSNSKASDIEPQKTDTSKLIGAPNAAPATTCFTVQYGRQQTDRYPMESTSTIPTKTVPTTPSPTLRPSPHSNTYGPIRALPQGQPLKTSPHGHHGEKSNGRTNQNVTSSASGAAPSTNRTARARSSAPEGAATVIGVVSNGATERVYDLTVDDAHEFFASGLLVHNCGWQAGSPESPGRIDASVYLAYELLPIPQSGEADALGSHRMMGVDLTAHLQPGDMGLIR